ncbi:PEP-CTERM sorting domain-containing protein [Methylomonas sp. MgM2]
MNKQLSILGGAIALSLSMNAHAYLPVDLFSVPISVGSGEIKDTTANGTAVFDTVDDTLDPGSIIGGWRDVSVNLITDNAPLNLNNGVSMQIVGDNTLAFNNDTNSGGEGVVQWNGQSGMQDLTVAGGFGLGLNAYDYGNAFKYETLTVDIGFWFSVSAFTDENTWTTFELLTTGPGVETIAFNSFETAVCGTNTASLKILCGSNGQVDMSDLGALEVRMNLLGQSLAVDLSISQIEAIPEPSIIALMGIGLMAAGFVSTRRRDATAIQA